MKIYKNYLLFLILICVSPCLILSQNNSPVNEKEKAGVQLKGLVTDHENKLPLAYASIGIFNKPVGTVSDSAGNYTLQMSGENMADTLQISLVGYETMKMPIKEFLNETEKNISLVRKNNLMQEVFVTNNNTNTEIIGREKSSKFLRLALHNTNAAELIIGSELGMKIKTNRNNAVLKNLNWKIAANNFNRIKFRINLYSIKNDLPDTLLSSKAIFGQIDNLKTGWIQFDLAPYNIKINGDFIITLQWAESTMDKKEKPVTLIPVSLSFAKNCYYRIASQDKWNKKGIKLSYYVTLAY